MAEVPDALEGMKLSQCFAGAAHQLQEGMDDLKLSLKSLDIGELLSSQVNQVMHQCTGLVTCSM